MKYKDEEAFIAEVEKRMANYEPYYPGGAPKETKVRSRQIKALASVVFEELKSIKKGE